MTPFTGQNMGAGQLARVGEGVRFAYRQDEYPAFQMAMKCYRAESKEPRRAGLFIASSRNPGEGAGHALDDLDAVVDALLR